MTRVPRQLHGIREPEPGLHAEDRGKPLDRPEDRVGDDGRGEGGHEGLRLDVVAVHQLGAEQGAAERRPEDGPDARGHAHGNRDPGIPGIEVEDAPEEGPEPGADLRRGSLAATGSTRSDGDRRGDELDERDAAADAARVVVERGDGRIGPVALGLGGPAEDDDPGDQPTERDHERDGPRARGVGDGGATLARRRRRGIAREHAQEEVRGEIERGVEEDRAEAADHADPGPEGEPLAQVGAPNGGAGGDSVARARRRRERIRSCVDREGVGEMLELAGWMGARPGAVRRGEPGGHLLEGPPAEAEDRRPDLRPAGSQPHARGAAVRPHRGRGSPARAARAGATAVRSPAASRPFARRWRRCGPRRPARRGSGWRATGGR